MSEKIQHYKAYYRDEKMLPCTEPGKAVNLYMPIITR
jgi:hypothetical protein